MIYVLLLCSHVYGGNHCLTQEFNTVEACKQFSEMAKISRSVDFTFSMCLPKGDEKR